MPTAAAPNSTTTPPSFTAFSGGRLLASGPLERTLLKAKEHHDRRGAEPLLIFDDGTGRDVDFDLRGTPEAVLERLAGHPLFAGTVAPADAVPRGPGRPRLGVTSREVTLLPRHWAWLERQPGGSSASLRRLVEEALRRDPGKADARRSLEAAGRCMDTLAGNLPGYEEASRALYRRDREGLKEHMRAWPKDVREHLERLAEEADAPGVA